MDVPDFVPRESHHILLKRGQQYDVMDDESWKQKRNMQELKRESLRPGYEWDILDHGHWLSYGDLGWYDARRAWVNREITPAIIFEDKCIYCEAAEHEIPFQKIQDVCNLCEDEWIKELECLWREYCEAGGNVKPAKQ